MRIAQLKSALYRQRWDSATEVIGVVCLGVAIFSVLGLGLAHREAERSSTTRRVVMRRESMLSPLRALPSMIACQESTHPVPSKGEAQIVLISNRIPLQVKPKTMHVEMGTAQFALETPTPYGRDTHSGCWPPDLARGYRQIKLALRGLALGIESARVFTRFLPSERCSLTPHELQTLVSVVLIVLALLEANYPPHHRNRSKVAGASSKGRTTRTRRR